MFRLHSGNWQGGMCNSLHQLQQNGILCDLTLYLADGKQMRMHSCVMAAASPYMREFIVAQRSNAHLDMLNLQALEALICYMYSGELEFSKVLLPGILTAARMLQMDPLVEELARYQKCFTQSPSRIVSRDGCVRQPDIASSLYLPDESAMTTTLATPKTERPQYGEQQNGDDASSASSSSDEDDEHENRRNSSLNNSGLNNSLPDLNLPCEACGKTFKQKGALGMHYKSHTIELANLKGELDTVKCKACNMQLKKGVHFLMHLKQCAKKEKFLPDTPSKEKPFHCPLCNNNFEQRGSFGSHMNTHCIEIYDKDRVRVAMKCKLCQQTFGEKTGFMEHVNICPGSSHSQQARILCRFANCTYAFQSRSSMLKHHAIHHGRKICMLFKSSQTLAKKTRPVLFKSGVTLPAEKSKTATVPVRSSCVKSAQFMAFKCAKCRKPFNTQAEYLRHKLTKHSFFCGRCGKKFPTQSTFEVHILECKLQPNTTGSDAPPPTIKCPLCKKLFKSVINMKNHMYQCMRFGTGAKMLQNTQSVQCELCKRSLSCQASLVNHQAFCKVAIRLKRNAGTDSSQETTVNGASSASRTSSVDTDASEVKAKKQMMNGANSKILSPSALLAKEQAKEKKELIEVKEEPSQPKVTFACEWCRDELPDEAQLLQHRQICANTYPCEACGHKFQTQAKYIAHKDKNPACVSSNDAFVEETHSCGACSETFNTAIKVTYHANKAHKPGPENNKALAVYRQHLGQCQVCRLKLSKHECPQYYHHMWTAHGVKSYVHSAYYKCEVCGARYVDPRHFEAHEATHEENHKRHVCTQCDQKFRRKQLLDRHVNEKHGGGKEKMD